MTIAEEDYLKVILKLELAQEELHARVTTNQVAEVIQTKPSSVTDMLKRLKEKSLVDYIKYKGIKLTGAGRKQALCLIRRHRLWETFLVEKLGLSWKTVHPVAEQLEHVHSDELLERLDEFLGHPAFDPHGEPIPNGEGKLPGCDGELMTTVKAGKNYTFMGIKEPTDTLLSYLDKIKLNIGSIFHVQDVEAYNGSVELEMGGKVCFLTYDVANKLVVKVNEKHENKN